MFDIGALELLMIVIVAVIVIGPKDMPLAMRTAGRWIGKLRRVSAHFRSGIDTMVREAELEDMEAKWKARNEEIMREHPAPTPPPAPARPDADTPGAGADEMTGPPALPDAGPAEDASSNKASGSAKNQPEPAAKDAARNDAKKAG